MVNGEWLDEYFVCLFFCCWMTMSAPAPAQIITVVAKCWCEFLLHSYGSHMPDKSHMAIPFPVHSAASMSSRSPVHPSQGDGTISTYSATSENEHDMQINLPRTNVYLEFIMLHVCQPTTISSTSSRVRSIVHSNYTVAVVVHSMPCYYILKQTIMMNGNTT